MAPTAQAGPHLFLDTARRKADAVRKSELRDTARTLRRQLAASVPNAADRVAELFLSETTASADSIVAAYWPHQTELDSRPLLKGLQDKGIPCALPVVQDDRRLLVFRAWRTGDPLAAGAYGIMEPLPDAAIVIPSHVVVPLLAFDASCYRLGYGAGHYDETLRTLRADKSLEAIGLAYAEQQCDAIPHDPHDEPLDCVITERGLVRSRP